MGWIIFGVHALFALWFVRFSYVRGTRMEYSYADDKSLYDDMCYEMAQNGEGLFGFFLWAAALVWPITFGIALIVWLVTRPTKEQRAAAKLKRKLQQEKDYKEKLQIIYRDFPELRPKVGS